MDYPFRRQLVQQSILAILAQDKVMLHDTEGLRAIKEAVPTVPLATGEDHHGRHACKEPIDRRAVDILQPDLRWCGRLTEAVKVYTMVEAAGLATWLHVGATQAEGQHFCLAMPEAGLAECLIFSQAGVPLEEVMRVPGWQFPTMAR